MSEFLLVHGAFRGGWSFAPVSRALARRGHHALAPSLRGMGEWTMPPDSVVTLGDWVDDLARLLQLHDAQDVVAVGHSQGGVVVTALAARCPERLAGVVYLDAPVPLPGERAVDLVGGPRRGAEDLPPATTWIAPTPLGRDAGLDEPLLAWTNARLCSTPMGPSLDVIIERELSVPSRVVFCRDTPAAYPSSISRTRFDQAGMPYELLDASHDVVITHPELVADLLDDAATVFSH